MLSRRPRRAARRPGSACSRPGPKLRLEAFGHARGVVRVHGHVVEWLAVVYGELELGGRDVDDEPDTAPTAAPLVSRSESTKGWKSHVSCWLGPSLRVTAAVRHGSRRPGTAPTAARPARPGSRRRGSLLVVADDVGDEVHRPEQVVECARPSALSCTIARLALFWPGSEVEARRGTGGRPSGVGLHERGAGRLGAGEVQDDGGDRAVVRHATDAAQLEVELRRCCRAGPVDAARAVAGVEDASRRQRPSRAPWVVTAAWRSSRRRRR